MAKHPRFSHPAATGTADQRRLSTPQSCRFAPPLNNNTPQLAQTINPTAGWFTPTRGGLVDQQVSGGSMIPGLIVAASLQATPIQLYASRSFDLTNLIRALAPTHPPGAANPKRFNPSSVSPPLVEAYSSFRRSIPLSQTFQSKLLKRHVRHNSAMHKLNSHSTHTSHCRPSRCFSIPPWSSP